MPCLTSIPGTGVDYLHPLIVICSGDTELRNGVSGSVVSDGFRYSQEMCCPALSFSIYFSTVDQNGYDW